MMYLIPFLCKELILTQLPCTQDLCQLNHTMLRLLLAKVSLNEGK